MLRVKLTKSTIDDLPMSAKELVYWDAACPGFGVKVTPTGRKVFIVLYRTVVPVRGCESTPSALAVASRYIRHGCRRRRFSPPSLRGAVAIRPSKFGRGLIAIRENEEAAEAIGVPVRRLKLAAFALSAAIPGVVGALMTLRSSYFEAAQAFDPLISFTIVTMAVVGGTDRPRGPIIGAVAFVLLSELLWSRLPQLYMIIVGVLLVAFILFLPRGMSGLFERRRVA
jgi:hypothetical protein